jgi:hypothetical protein
MDRIKFVQLDYKSHSLDTRSGIKGNWIRVQNLSGPILVCPKDKKHNQYISNWVMHRPKKRVLHHSIEIWNHILHFYLIIHQIQDMLTLKGWFRILFILSY